MDRGAVARGDRPRHGGVPTPGSRRARLATAAAALILAAAIAAYVVVAGSLLNGIVPLACLVGVALVATGTLAVWEAGLVAGPAVLLAAYALSLAPGDAPLDGSAPLVAVGLIAVVELGSWSLELRDGPEERRLAHLGQVVLLLVAAFAACLVVLAVGGLRADAGIVLWVVGAAAAFGLFALLASPTRKALTNIHL